MPKMSPAAANPAVTPPCPHFGVCGGCAWQDVPYEKQCETKLETINAALKENGIVLKKDNFIPAKNIYHYRNRMDFAFAVDGSLGLRARGRWDLVVNLSVCHLLSPAVSGIMNIVRALAKESGVPFRNNRAHCGFWRYLVVREGKNTNERLVLITTSAEQTELPLGDKFAAALKPFATSLVWGINPEKTDSSIPQTTTSLFGNDYLTEKINGYAYRIPCASFFQTNSEMAAVLQNTVSEFVAPAPDDRIMDLYCGSGFLTMALAKKAKQIIGVEIDDAAAALARTNDKLNNLSNVEFRPGATENILSQTFADMSPDAIVVDPPRAGLHPKALETLTSSGVKRLIYVSCNPASLARDLKTLLKNYFVEEIRGLDLFPHTPHVETVVKLKIR
jgi:23S rRNA (uracil1939-C5)-methyltransferase